jgi:hypothetical protein
MTQHDRVHTLRRELLFYIKMWDLWVATKVLGLMQAGTCVDSIAEGSQTSLSSLLASKYPLFGSQIFARPLAEHDSAYRAAAWRKFSYMSKPSANVTLPAEPLPLALAHCKLRP